MAGIWQWQSDQIPPRQEQELLHYWLQEWGVQKKEAGEGRQEGGKQGGQERLEGRWRQAGRWWPGPAGQKGLEEEELVLDIGRTAAAGSPSSAGTAGRVGSSGTAVAVAAVDTWPVAAAVDRELVAAAVERELVAVAAPAGCPGANQGRDPPHLVVHLEPCLEVN